MTEPVFVHGQLAAREGDAVVELPESEARHAVGSLRLRVGDGLTLTDGRGTAVRGHVAEIHGLRVSVAVTEWLHPAPAQPAITLVQAIPKGAGAELSVELATQAGIDVIVPWHAQRCIARWVPTKAAKQHDKWVNAATAAAKQSRRLFVPQVDNCVTTRNVCERIAACTGAGGRAFVLHETAGISLAGVPHTEFSDSDIIVVVGPEGGITDEELDGFTDNGALPVLLGSEVFRSATAGMAAGVALGLLTGRWVGASTKLEGRNHPLYPHTSTKAG